MTDLVILTADKDAEEAMRALLSRNVMLGIEPIAHTIVRAPDHDPGVLRQASELLRLYIRSHRYAIAMLDLHGSGRDSESREDVEADLEQRLEKNGWSGRCAAIVIDPELECWIWSDSRDVATALGWNGRLTELQQWLRDECHVQAGARKPRDPKAAMHGAIRKVGKARSSAIFSQIASSVDATSCTDSAYLKLVGTLRSWFAGTRT